MNYFDFVTEEEINNIQKTDCLYTTGIISLNDKKNKKIFDSYAYQKYLQKTNNYNTKDIKGGAFCE